MSIPRLLVALIVMLLDVLLGVLCYLHFANLDRHRNQIEALVSDATGREFRIGGTLDVDVWPGLALQAEQLSLANAPWGSKPQMAEIGRVAVRVAPLSLLFGPLEVNDLELRDVALLLEADADGSSNWSLGKPSDPAAEAEARPAEEAGGGLRLIVTNARISNVVVTQAGPKGSVELARIDELKVTPGSDDNLQLTGDGALMAFPLSLEGHLGTTAGIRDTGAADLSLSGALGDLNIELGGHLRATGSADNDRLELAVRADNIAAVIEGADLGLPLAGPFALKAGLDNSREGMNSVLEGSLADMQYRATIEQRGREVSAEGTFTHLEAVGEMLGVAGLPASDVTVRARFTVSDAALELAELVVASGDARINASGTLPSGDRASTLKLHAKGSRLTDLLSTLPPLAFEGSADLVLSQNSVSIDPLQARVGSSDLAGRLVVEAGDRTSISGKLSSTRLDLTEFAAGEEAADQAGAAPATPAQTPPGKYVFTEEPLPLEPLRTAEAALEVDAAELVTAAITMSDLAATVDLKGGNLELDARFKGPRGGLTTGRIGLDASGEQADLTAAVKMRDLRINIASGDVKDVSDIPPVDITLDLATSGASPRALAARSNGRVLLTLGPGKLESGLLGRVSGDVIAQLTAALNPFQQQDPQTLLECGLAVVGIDNGLATLEPMIVQNEKVTILAAGTVDFSTEALALEFNTQPRKGVGVSADMFVTPFVALRGTLANPSVGVNEKGTLLTAGAAVATGGLSFLAQAVKDRAGGAIDHCATDLIKQEHQHPGLADE
jgi:uncharacterized protein involved in outer membrane biogenesis